MTTVDPMFDQRVADWLEDDPVQAPPSVLETLVAAFPSIPQRRRRIGAWRTVSGARPRRLVMAGVLAATLLVAMALLAGVGRRPTQTVPTPPLATAPAAIASTRATASPRPQPSPTQTPLLSNGLIVFEHFQNKLGTRIEVLQPNGLGKELLPSVKGLQERPAWSPDGTRLAFVGWDRRDPTARPSIWETDGTGAPPRLLTTSCELPDCNEERDPSYSADGTKMVFVRSAGPADGPPVSTVIAIRDLATGVVTELEATRTRDADGFLDHPSLSPDGRRVVYARVLTTRDGSATDSAVMRADVAGGDATALTPDGWEAGDPSWSPDGTQILFAREPTHYWSGAGKGAGENTFVYTMAADGSDVAQLTSSNFDSAGSPSWTANGAQILLVAQGIGLGPGGDVPSRAIGTPDIQVMAPDGADRSPVARFGDCCRWYPVQQPTP